jgi:hypothetical protein
MPASPSGEDATVQITVTGKNGAPLPNGLLASIVFKVTDDARGPQVVKLANAARAFAPGAGTAPLDGVAGKDGEIELLAVEPAVIACFFYMH